MVNNELKNAKILIVDDQKANILVLENILHRQGFEKCRSLTDSRLVISTFQEWQPDLILLDLMMPNMSGLAVMEALKLIVPENEYFPILMLTADITAEAKQRALSEGAMDFLTKPYDFSEVILRVTNLLRTRGLHQQLQNQNVILEAKVQERTADLARANLELVNAYETTIEGWSHALDLRDKETEGHSLRVTEMTMELAHAAGISETELVHIHRGALLHDIGKMGVPDGILLKPGKLTDEEWVVMRKHPVYAFELLSPIAYLCPAIDIPYCHHEKWDGSGYPRGLKGEEIPLAARIFAIVDVWDALRSDRPYRKAWPKEKTFEHIKTDCGTHFDPKVVDLFFQMMDKKKEEQ